MQETHTEDNSSKLGSVKSESEVECFRLRRFNWMPNSQRDIDQGLKKGWDIVVCPTAVRTFNRLTPLVAYSTSGLQSSE
jgi:hypothetical protein